MKTPTAITHLIEKGHRFGFDLVLFWTCFGLTLESVWFWIGSELGHGPLNLHWIKNFLGWD